MGSGRGCVVSPMPREMTCRDRLDARRDEESTRDPSRGYSSKHRHAVRSRSWTPRHTHVIRSPPPPPERLYGHRPPTSLRDDLNRIRRFFKRGVAARDAKRSSMKRTCGTECLEEGILLEIEDKWVKGNEGSVPWHRGGQLRTPSSSWRRRGRGIRRRACRSCCYGGPESRGHGRSPGHQGRRQKDAGRRDNGAVLGAAWRRISAI